MASGVPVPPGPSDSGPQAPMVKRPFELRL